MWKLKTKTIPVVVGALGMIKRSTQNFIDQIPGKPSLQENAENSTHKYCSHTAKSTLNVNTLTSLKLIRAINKLLNFAITWDMNHLQKISYLLKDIYLFLFTVIY